jgi:hypothetical protein
MLLLAGLAGSSILPSAGKSVSPPRRATFIDVKRSFGTTDSAIRRAIVAARSSRRALYFAPGTYTHRGMLVLDGITAFGNGQSSILVAQNPSRSAVILKGTHPVLRDIQIASPAPAERLQTSAAAGVRVDGANRFVVQRVKVAGAENAGIVVFGGTNGLIADNTVSGALADGIHLTAGSHAVRVSGNAVHDVGDDMIAVVSYLSDPYPCSDVLITGNDVRRETSGRGITAVGGRDVTIQRNTISRTHGAGVLVASDRSYGTYGTEGVKVLNNVIDTTDLGHIGHAGIQLFGQPGSIIRNTLVSGNVVRNTSSRGVYVGGYTQLTTVSGNRLTNISDAGIYLDEARDAVVVANTVAQVDDSGIYATRGVTGRLVINSNVLADVNRARMPGTYVIRIEPNAGLTNGEIVDNSYSGPAGYPYQGLVGADNPRIVVSGNRVVD